MTQYSWILKKRGRSMSWTTSDGSTMAQSIKLECGHGTMGRWVWSPCVLLNRLRSRNWLLPVTLLCFFCFSLMRGFWLHASLSWKKAEPLHLVGEIQSMWCESSQPWWDYVGCICTPDLLTFRFLCIVCTETRYQTDRNSGPYYPSTVSTHKGRHSAG